MSISWTCKFGFYHDRQVVFDEPASNNGWIYSALASLVNLPIDEQKLIDTFYQCINPEDSFWLMRRRPDKATPPISRDELIGMSVLGFIGHVLDIQERKWSWLMDPELMENYSIFETIAGFWEARNKHRNYIWKNELLACFPLMFSFRAHDRFYFKTLLGNLKEEPIALWERLSWKVYKHWTNWRGTPGEKNIMWAQCKVIKDPYHNKVNYKENFKLYFPVGHIIPEEANGA